MRIKFHVGIKKLFLCNASRENNHRHADMGIQEEYANAFRTESYTDFWTRVLVLEEEKLNTYLSVGSSSAARLPSYRLFAEHLLDPNQSTVSRVLDLTRNDQPEKFSLLSNYFATTADAFHLCGLLLKDIDHTRSRYKYAKDPFNPSPSGSCGPCPLVNHFPMILARLNKFSKSNPFTQTAPTVSHFQAVQANCSKLLKQLQSSRVKIQAKLRILSKIKFGSAVFLVAFTASLAIIIATHAFVMLVAAPGIMATSLELVSEKKQVKELAQLNAAAKGTYILTRDLDTISRLVARLNDEMEHVHDVVKLWLQRGDDQLQANGKVASQLKRNDQSFIEQLDELEEHLYLCFMTINRARNLVIKEL
ncbi:UPF0496 protein At3g49070-like [Olea europaea var. sylvestris]|uniref:UPF0496 protein At3g49070-like n=1 Tax=Olea europaea var. sylvestris TaxID=158386 RepID=UPI000C1D4006|nr:UPF0496 protein At3g49070-like [Olea europaea var. sylvestris]